MMTYGIPTLMEFSDAEVLTRFCAEHGFAFVEMNMTFPWFQPGQIDAGRLRALMEKYGVGFTIHLHDQVNPFEFSPELREGNLRNIGWAIDLALALGLSRINMHLMPGTYSTINGVKTYLYDHCLDTYLDYVRAFRRLVDERLKGSGTVFCIENTSGYKPFHQKAIGLLLESDAFGLTFDIGHSYRAGGGDERFILRHRERLYHFHIHDCDVKANHRGFGDGQLDLTRYLVMARELGATVVAEVKESGALLRSREYIMVRKLW